MEAALGGRLLQEAKGESLEKVLGSLRAAHHHNTSLAEKATTCYRIKSTKIPSLDEIVSRHFQETKIGGLSISGRYLALIYKIVSTLASSPHFHAIIIIDYEGHFQASRLSCSRSDLDHVYVVRPADDTRYQVKEVIHNSEEYLLYNERAKGSARRKLWGSIVIGGFGGGDITAGWKGWLRVDREEVWSFPCGISIKDALAQRAKRQAAVDAAGWQASSDWGGFIFHSD